MTCIVAHVDGWMVADRRVTFQGSLLGPYNRAKILRHGSGESGTLFATSGQGEVSDYLADAVEGVAPADLLRTMAGVFKANKDQASAIVLRAGIIYELDPRGGTHALKSPFWAMGSGYQAALGYLNGMRHTLANHGHGRAITPADAVEAIEYSATLNADVGDGTQVEFL